MNKRDAEQYVEERAPTWGDLRAMLMMAALEAGGGPSTVNPSLTKAQALNILITAIRERDAGKRVGESAAPTRDALLATNIVRECVLSTSGRHPGADLVGEDEDSEQCLHRVSWNDPCERCELEEWDDG